MARHPPAFIPLLLLLTTLTTAWELDLFFDSTCNNNAHLKRRGTPFFDFDFLSDAIHDIINGEGESHTPAPANCNAVKHFGSGSDPATGWCLQGGQNSVDGVENGSCRYYTECGKNVYGCSVPMKPLAKSYRIKKGTTCCIGVSGSVDCDDTTCFKGDGNCHKGSELERLNDVGGPMYLIFQCYDE